MFNLTIVVFKKYYFDLTFNLTIEQENRGTKCNVFKDFQEAKS